MESKIKADFIPDKIPTGQPVAAPTYTSGTTDIIMLVAVVMFAASLALAAGVFLYDQYLSSNAASKGEQLARARAAFEPRLIEQLLKLDERLKSADAVLNAHIAPSELLRIIGELTLRSVSFETLRYQMNEDGTLGISMEGKAANVNGVALQASVFGQNNAIINPIFSDLDLVEDGVTFKVDAQVNPAAIRYVNVVTRRESAGASNDGYGYEEAAFDEFGGFGATEGL